MKIGGWRTRSVFDRYAIVSRNDIADAIFKLQESEKRAEQERALAEAQHTQDKAQFGHSDEVLTNPTAPKTVN